MLLKLTFSHPVKLCENFYPDCQDSSVSKRQLSSPTRVPPERRRHHPTASRLQVQQIGDALYRWEFPGSVQIQIGFDEGVDMSLVCGFDLRGSGHAGVRDVTHV